MSPFATNNVVSIETTVDFFIDAGEFTYEYNALGYPTSVSFAGTIHTDKDGNSDHVAFTERYTYYCKKVDDASNNLWRRTVASTTDPCPNFERCKLKSFF